MPNIKAAKKSLRQSEKRKTRNLKRKRIFRETIKQIKKLSSEKQTEKAQKLIPRAYKALDKAAKTKAIKKNTASRKKSRLMKSLAKVSK